MYLRINCSIYWGGCFKSGAYYVGKYFGLGLVETVSDLGAVERIM